MIGFFVWSLAKCNLSNFWLILPFLFAYIKSQKKWINVEIGIPKSEIKLGSEGILDSNLFGISITIIMPKLEDHVKSEVESYKRKLISKQGDNRNLFIQISYH